MNKNCLKGWIYGGFAFMIFASLIMFALPSGIAKAPAPTSEASVLPSYTQVTQAPFPTNIPSATPTPFQIPTITQQLIQLQTIQQPEYSGATALCNDGTESYSQSHRGTCSHHGGVSEWYR